MTSGRLKLQFISRCRLGPLSALRRRSRPPCFLVPIASVENPTDSRKKEQAQQIDAMMRAMDGLANMSTWPPGCRLLSGSTIIKAVRRPIRAPLIFVKTVRRPIRHRRPCPSSPSSLSTLSVTLAAVVALTRHPTRRPNPSSSKMSPQLSVKNPLEHFKTYLT